MFMFICLCFCLCSCLFLCFRKCCVSVDRVSDCVHKCCVSDLCSQMLCVCRSPLFLIFDINTFNIY